MTLFKTPRFFRILFPNKTWSFPFSKNAVYLTFDDGPDPEVTPYVLDLLQQKKIKATFFCVGENVQKYSELYKRILEEGHSVGNHCMRHERGTQTEINSYIDSVNEASELIQSELFRPPYGRITFKQTRKLSVQYKIIMWSWLSYDFDNSIPVQRILSKAKTQISNGDILVFHDNKKSFERLKILLPEVIMIINKKGLEFLSIEMMK